MNEKYIISSEELAEKGINLGEYTIDGSFDEIIIHKAVDMLVTRILKLNDKFKSVKDIEKDLDSHEYKEYAFKKLQYAIIYNLIFVGDSDPLDAQVNDIIVYDLDWGKINGFQKGWF